jgi:hypothetical protein
VPHDILIGGLTSGAANIIAFNIEGGIAIEGFVGADPTNITISGNSIFENGGLGIDLGNDGVTLNDPGDTDLGVNNLQNFPVIIVASDDGINTTVRGTLDTPNPETVTIELFCNEVIDNSGFGEGQVFLGTTTPEANGNFLAILPGGLVGKYITATATDAAGNTSEFSAAVLVIEGGPNDLTLLPPMPGLAGMLNTLEVNGGTPGATIFLVIGFRSSSTAVPGCAGVTVDIANPRLRSRAVVDINGNASFSFFIPGSVSGQTALFQAIDRSSCTVSNLITHSFP